MDARWAWSSSAMKACPTGSGRRRVWLPFGSAIRQPPAQGVGLPGCSMTAAEMTWPRYSHCIKLMIHLLTEGSYQTRSEEHTSELQSRENLVCRLLLEKKKKKK